MVNHSIRASPGRDVPQCGTVLWLRRQHSWEVEFRHRGCSSGKRLNVKRPGVNLHVLHRAARWVDIQHNALVNARADMDRFTSQNQSNITSLKLFLQQFNSLFHPRLPDLAKWTNR